MADMDHKEKEHTLREICNMLAGWSAMAGIWDAGFAMLFALRESFYAKALMGSEGGHYFKGIRYHIVLGYTSFLMMSIHTIYFLIAYLVDQTFIQNVFPWGSTMGYWNFFGLISYLALLMMVCTSIFKVRRNNYRLFYWTHQLYVIFLLAAFCHYFICWYPMLGPVAFFIFDRLTRTKKFERKLNARFSLVSSEIVRVDFKPLRLCEYHPGDYVNLLIPTLSGLNWHPFSIASSSKDSNHISIFIKARNNWTRALIGKIGNQSIILPIEVDGPFGARHVNYLSEQSIIFAAAGTGMAALSPFIHESIRAGKNFEIHWTCKHLGDVLCYTELLETLKASNSTLNVHITKSEDSFILPGNYETHSNSTVEGTSENVGNTVLVLDEHPKSPVEKSEKLRNFVFALLVFAGIVLGYSLGRILVFSYNMDECMAKTANMLPGWSHFMCWYYYYIMPFIYAVLIAVTLGLGYIYLSYNSLNSTAPPYSKPMDEVNFREAFEIKKGRPVWSKIICSNPESAVIVAGPERMVKDIEVISLKNGNPFYRESWKV